jgi:hypothetical protein
MSETMLMRRAVSTSGFVFAGLLFNALLTGCASSSSPPPATSAAATEVAPEGSVAAPPECVNAEDQQVECLSDADCCAGFVCGKDPELSQRVSYCLYGG